MKSKTTLPLLSILIVCLLSIAWATFSRQGAASAQAQFVRVDTRMESEAFEVIQHRWYKHPRRDWEINLDKVRLSAHGPHANSNYWDIRTFKIDQWGLLEDANSRRIPLAVYWDGERLLAKWLP